MRYVTALFLTLIALGTPAIFAQTNTPPTAIDSRDRLIYNNTELKFRKNEDGQHIYTSSRGSRIFDPKTLTLSIPMSDDGYTLKVNIQKTDPGWEKIYYTRPLIGTGCPVDLLWKMNQITSKETATFLINGKEFTLEVDRAKQKGTWACGQHGGGSAEMTITYSPALDLVIAIETAMEFNGRTSSGSTRLLEIQRPSPN